MFVLLPLNFICCSCWACEHVGCSASLSCADGGTRHAYITLLIHIFSMHIFDDRLRIFEACTTLLFEASCFSSRTKSKNESSTTSIVSKNECNARLLYLRGMHHVFVKRKYQLYANSAFVLIQ